VPPPVPRCSGRASSSLISPSRVSLPRNCGRVGLHIVLFEACAAFTRVAARTLAPSPICDALHRRLQPFRHLHDCSGCFRLERSPGGACTHWRAPPSHGAHVNRTLEIAKTLNTRPAPPESCGKENLWVRRGRYFIGSPGCVRSSAWIWLFRRPRRAPADRRRDRPRRVACRRIRGPWRA
jgi:hypothetical protein